MYEREDGAQLYVETHVGGHRRQRSLGAVVGHPVYDKAEAKAIAVAMAASLESGHRPQTLEALLAAMHREREHTWSPSHKRDQRRYRAFWLERGITNPEATVAAEAHRCGWSARTQQAYLRYLADAFRFGEWPKRIRVPKVKSRGASYTLEEVQRLLAAMALEGPEAEMVAWVCFVTGRRLNAVRLLRASDVTVRDGYVLLAFRAHNDKARADGIAVLSGHPAELVVALRDTGRDYLTGPMRRELLISKLRHAEHVAAVPHVHGRAFHGFKRAFATLAGNRKAASLQSGTDPETLRWHYERNDIEASAQLCQQLCQKVSGPASSTGRATDS